MYYLYMFPDDGRYMLIYTPLDNGLDVKDICDVHYNLLTVLDENDGHYIIGWF